MLKILKTWFCFVWMPLYFGGDSSSQADQTQTTETQDNRISAAQDSVSINTSRGTVGDLTVNTTDNGAVNSAFAFANQIAQGAADMQAASLGAVKTASSNALQAVQSAYAQESSTLADAYKTAKAGEQKVLVAGTVGLLALALIKIFAGGR